MKLYNLKRLNVGFYFTLLSLIVSVAALVLFIITYNIFGYNFNRMVFFMTFLSIWLMGFITVNTIFMGEKPFWVSYLYVLITVLLVFSFVQFLNPCLSPIGIYFTVHNMGDVETNALGVPRSIATGVLYLIAIVCNLVASFTPSVTKGGEK
ncbi:MAG: hypothetical protein E7369_01595 [Clostridiales bacterium]|nr:hypothetical protein [Clostridiales bacterium]